MNKRFAIVLEDRRLAITFSGIILCGIALLALLITAGVLFI